MVMIAISCSGAECLETSIEERVEGRRCLMVELHDARGMKYYLSCWWLLVSLG